MNGLLNGINVLDFGRAAVGPWAASLLGSMGANVIRVESPDGDGMLAQQPLQGGYGVAYTIYNANKKGLILDLKSPDSEPHLRRLVEKADLIIENLTPGALERIGIGYEDAKAMNPSIVYASCPGWGYSGPIKDLAAGDPDFQAFSGFASLNGDEGGKMEMFRHSYPLDLHAGILFASTALLGLLARGGTGKSQRVTASHLGSSLLMQISRAAEYLLNGKTPRPLGSASGGTAPHEAFLCQDQRYLAVGVENNAQWHGLCKALSRDDLLQDTRWTTNRERVEGRQELARELGDTFITKPARWWAIQLEKQDVPFGYFYDFETLRNHRQVTENSFFVETNVPDQGRMFMGNPPWRFGSAETRTEAGPRHGQHTAELLESGFDAFGNGVAAGEPSPATSRPDGSPPLAGIRVVDASQGLTGPYLSLLLADAGAEVIKVEPPSGDYAREFAPSTKTGDSAPFLLLNRNKKGVTLDTTSPEGVKSLRRLIDGADIFIEDWGPGKADSLGLGYHALRAESPGLIHCAISAFGERGPFKDRPGSELVAQAYSECFLSLGQLNGAPLRAGSDMGSMSTGAAGFLGVLAALLRRQRSGQGERVAVSLFGTLVSLRQANWSSLGDPDTWAGGYAEPYGGQRNFGHATKDVRLFARPRRGNSDMDALVAKIKEAVGDRGYEGGPQVKAGALRLPIPEEYFKNLSSDEAKEVLFSAGGQAVDFNNLQQVIEHAQAKAVDVIKEMDHPTLGPQRVMVKSWNGPWEDPTLAPSPTLGQHNAEFLNGH
ncbi:MAG: CoA transferase [Chloroflexi bacterium]|nr:CoA transferase [Chloroflexota bacterium]